jgi:hypothetical protein
MTTRGRSKIAPLQDGFVTLTARVTLEVADGEVTATAVKIYELDHEVDAGYRYADDGGVRKLRREVLDRTIEAILDQGWPFPDWETSDLA